MFRYEYSKQKMLQNSDKYKKKIKLVRAYFQRSDKEMEVKEEKLM